MWKSQEADSVHLDHELNQKLIHVQMNRIMETLRAGSVCLRGKVKDGEDGLLINAGEPLF